jgi:hypothetical protein
VVPVIAISACERSEKERIVIQDAYTLTIAVAVPESLSEQSSVAERNVYAYGRGCGQGGTDGEEVQSAESTVFRGKLGSGYYPASYD